MDNTYESCSSNNVAVLDTPNNFDESSKDRYHVQIIVSWADEKEIAVPKDNADRIALMKTLTDNWAEPFRSLVKKLPEDTEARSIRIEDWIFSPSRTHIHPRAVLMGDSAHTMTMCKFDKTYTTFKVRTPLIKIAVRGEGANNAIVDVQDLINRVDMKDPK